MITLAELVVKLLADAEGYSKTFNDAEEKATGLGTHIGGIAGTIGKALGGALLAGGTALLGGLTASVVAAAEAEEGVAQLEAVIQSTGGKAGVTAQAALDLASSLQQVTKFEDDTILSAENMLLTFTNIHSEVFPQATETALNLAQAMGGDVKGASIQLGKALNDPITGITALTRVGVTFTEQQKEQIKALQESGDMMGAQKIVLAELSTEFGGAARAAGSTFAGQLAILKNSLGDITEEVGGRILPVITPLVSRFKEFAIDALPMVSAALDTVIPKIVDGLGQAINFVTANFGRVRDTVVGVFNTIVEWVNLNIMPTINDVLIPLFWRVVDFVVVNWPIVRDTIVGAFWAVVDYVNTQLIPALLNVWNWISGYWPMVRDALVGAFWTVVGYLQGTVVPFFNDTVLPLFQQIWAWVVANWPILRDTVIGAFWDAVAWVQANWPIVRDTVINVFSTALAWIEANVMPFINGTLIPLFNRVVTWITDNWGKIGETSQDVFAQVMGYINGTILPFINDTLIPLFWSVVDWVTTNWPIIRDKVIDTFNTVVGWVQGTLLPFINGTLIPLFWSVVNWVETNWPKIYAVIESVWGFLKGAYDTVLAPVIGFIIERFQFVVGWVQENWPLIQKTIATIFGWFNGEGKGNFWVIGNEIAIVFDFIKTIVSQAMEIVLGIIKLAMQLITGDVEGAGNTLKKIFADIFWGILNIIATVANLWTEIVKGVIITVIDTLAGAGTASKLAGMLGLDLTKKSDILGGLGVNRDSLYSALGVNGAPTTEPKTNVINGMGTNGGMVVNNYITTRDDPNAIADATARELRLSQAGMYAP